MRNIGETVYTAVKHFREFRNGNTYSKVSRGRYKLYLHRTMVGSVDMKTGEWSIFTGGWDTAVTRDRINAFLYAVTSAVSVAIRKREMHLFVSHLKDGVVTYEDKGAFSKFTSKQLAG